MIENTVEELVIELLKAQGFDYIYGPDVSPDGEGPWSYDVSSLFRLSTTGRRSSQGGSRKSSCFSRKKTYIFWINKKEKLV